MERIEIANTQDSTWISAILSLCRYVINTSTLRAVSLRVSAWLTRGNAVRSSSMLLSSSAAPLHSRASLAQRSFSCPLSSHYCLASPAGPTQANCAIRKLDFMTGLVETTRTVIGSPSLHLLLVQGKLQATDITNSTNGRDGHTSRAECLLTTDQWVTRLRRTRS